MRFVQIVCQLDYLYRSIFFYYCCAFVGDYADTCFVVIIIMLQPGVRVMLLGVSDSCSST